MTGYKKKPLLIVIFSIIFVLNPIGNILFILVSNLENSPLFVARAYATAFASGDFFVVVSVLLWVSALFLAYGLFKVRSWAWYYFIAYAVVMIIFSMFAPKDGKIIFNLTSVFFFNLLVLIPMGIFISKEIRTPYLNPHTRWWEQATRYKHSETVIINNKEFETFDISETGAFVIDKEGEINSKVGDRVPVAIHLDDIKIDCHGEIVWINKDSSKLPKGIGVKFIGIDRASVKLIKDFIKSLIKEGKETVR